MLLVEGNQQQQRSEVFRKALPGHVYAVIAIIGGNYNRL